MREQEMEYQDPATTAFARLEGEVALMRRAVEQLAAERADIHIPDYTDTLGELSKHLGAAERTLRTIVAKPAMELTPEEMARQIDRAARQARDATASEMQRAQVRFDNAAYELRGTISTLRAAHEQRLHLIWAVGGGIVAGCLLWSILPGAFARALPDRWQLPERMAAHIVGAPTIWEGGVRLMQAGSPEAYRAISAAAVMRHDNKDKIAACEKSAERSKKSVRCTIQIKENSYETGI
ncbi:MULTISPECIES: DUF6118 family protein [Alphaproteobacteria]|jgi:hypothetical protein|uniref:Uncharacterized protein n=1 Tax=Sphingopyxis bauzanensis TaxID=651663 RepID=A0A246JS17_9SPHN|nr:MULTISPECIES: DUF6118 family protein [Sphingopyxis]KGB57720.1 hypothetical protein FG95_01675 [Sphingopyxis sp. LC363]OWQ95636.1 hypothetical protein CDQ92_12645 [Sphingopyxis bauzanensis]GGJ38670.1 hypothetical protein GCM10011393_06160 [Sphingopyxis bauzanensis]